MSILSVYDEEKKQWSEITSLKGTPASIEIGEVTTLPENSQAYVNNAGDSSAAILEFGLPRGSNGLTPVRGEDYWTAEDQEQIINDVSTKLDFQFNKLMNSILNKPETYIFQNKAELDQNLSLSDNTLMYKGEKRQLNPGDIFLLTDTDEPDYWFGEDSYGEKLHELESRKVDLSNYIQKSNIAVMSYTEYEEAVSAGTIKPDIFYFVYEE